MRKTDEYIRQQKKLYIRRLARAKNKPIVEVDFSDG